MQKEISRLLSGSRGTTYVCYYQVSDTIMYVFKSNDQVYKKGFIRVNTNIYK